MGDRIREENEHESTMLASERQEDILRKVRLNKILRIKDLAAEYGVHEMTVRRDLDQLAERGQLDRFHGGARLSEKHAEDLSHVLRSTQNILEKERIARAAFDLIQDGDAIALDASTSSLALANLLSARKVEAFVTSLDAADVLAASGTPFVLIGGQFNFSARSFVGGFFQQILSHLLLGQGLYSRRWFYRCAPGACGSKDRAQANWRHNDRTARPYQVRQEITCDRCSNRRSRHCRYRRNAVR